ncbi:MAG TPA: beta-galactosidase [Thermotogota bacterium]|nr:beta-galactosidase [Thermotogota bacterium]HRW91633.1 beta-galactosidase [Thermotogota bacterium]
MLGVDYYPEQWPEERMDRDMKIMKSHGIDLVRVGEFMWSKLQPSEEKLDFAFLDRVMDCARENQLQVILGTPSATPPAWVIRKFPDILQKDAKGHVKHFGSRRHYCYNSIVYRNLVMHMVKNLAQRYGHHPALYAWQVDNEFGCEDTTFCYCEKCDEAFSAYLQERYGEIQALNHDWGTVFWSQEYVDFSQVQTPKWTTARLNPTHVLEYNRFVTQSIGDFAQKQVDFIRSFSPRPITHNLMVNFTEINYAVHQSLYDFLSYDNYFPNEEFEPMVAAFNLDLLWSLKRKPFAIMEQQPGRVNWQQKNWYYPASWIKPYAAQGFAHGAKDILFFRYRALPYGAEQYHNAILNYDGEPENSPRLPVVQQLSQLPQIAARPTSQVALFFDYESAWMHQINGVIQPFPYVEELLKVYRSLRGLGFNVDFVFPGDTWESYSLLVVPYALHLSPSTLEKLASFPGKCLVTCMSGSKTASNHIRSDRVLGLDLPGLSFKTLDFGASKPFQVEGPDLSFEVDGWFEEVEVTEGCVLGLTKHPLGWTSVGIAGDRMEDPRWLYVASIPTQNGWDSLLSWWTGRKSCREEGTETILLDGNKIVLDFHEMDVQLQER